MTEGKTAGLLVRFALPLMAGDLVNLAYTIADSMVVGRLIGVNAFAAVSAAFSFYFLLVVMIQGTGRGFTVLIGQSYGAADQGALRRSSALSISLALGIGAFLTILGFALLRPVLVLMRTPAEILEDTHRYLAILFAGIWLLFLNAVLFGTIHALGDSRTPLMVSIAASAFNVVLDIVLVRYTPLGVGAVALATVASQFLSGLFCYRYLVRHGSLRLTWGDFRPDPPVIRELLRLGAPIGFQNGVAAAAGLVIQYVINGYGPVFIAGVAAAKRLYSVIFIIGGGLSGALGVFTAQNYGAGRFDRIRRGMLVTGRLMFAGLALIIPLMFVLGRRALGLLISGGEAEVNAVLDAAERQLRVCLVLLPALYLIFLYRSALQGMGNSFMPMLSGLLEAALRILAVCALPLFLHEWGVFIAEPAGWPFMALQLGLACRVVYKRKSSGAPSEKLA